jgi:hypothetical protein
MSIIKDPEFLKKASESWVSMEDHGIKINPEAKLPSNWEPKVTINFRHLLSIYVILMNHPDIETLQLTSLVEEILVEAAREAVEMDLK